MLQGLSDVKPEILSRYDGDSGFFIKRFFMDDTFNFNRLQLHYIICGPEGVSCYMDWDGELY